MRLVIKYGGSSLRDAGELESAARYAASLSGTNEITLVCSAMDGVTDELYSISEMIARGARSEARDAADRLISRHNDAAESLVGERLPGLLEPDLEEFTGLVDGMTILAEVTPRSLDHLVSFGERLSSRLLSAAITEQGAGSAALTGMDAGIFTDSNFGESRPLMDTTRLRVSKTLEPLLKAGKIPVVGGFAGGDQHGRVTTFGRGGSDYTATIIASCIGADEVWLMSGVDGLMSADPRLVADAGVLAEVSYAEAVEMALFGAKQIHPRTFEPLLEREIPMRIRNSRETGNAGTLVSASPAADVQSTVKCVSMIPHSAMIDVRGGSMVGAPGTAARIFQTLAGAGINVMMISQNPSESSITMVVKDSDLDGAVAALEMNLLGSIIKKIDVNAGVAIVALIGSGMRGTVGVASRVFAAAARNSINVAMITQGSSELNLALVTKDQDAGVMVRALHDEFDLSTRHRTANPTK